MAMMKPISFQPRRINNSWLYHPSTNYKEGDKVPVIVIHMVVHKVRDTQVLIQKHNYL